MNAQAGVLAEKAYQKFLSVGREAVVCFSLSALEKSMMAFVKLNFRDEIASQEPSVELYYTIMRSAFICLLDAGTIVEAHPLTSLGWDFIESCRRDTGVGLENLPAPNPVVAPVDELREQIRWDWANISTDKVREKARTNVAYAKALNQMLEDDTIGSTGTTAFTRIEGASEQPATFQRRR